MSSHLRAEVRQAASVLDVIVPDWFRRIDPATLDMGSCTLCVLGQVFGREAEGSITSLVYGSPWGYARERVFGLSNAMETIANPTSGENPYGINAWVFSGSAAEKWWLDEICAREQALARGRAEAMPEHEAIAINNVRVNQ